MASVARSNVEPPFTPLKGFVPPSSHSRSRGFSSQAPTSVHTQGHVRSASGDTHPPPSREGSISHYSSSLPSRGRGISHHSSALSSRRRSVSHQPSIPPTLGAIKCRHSDMESFETPSLSNSDTGSKQSRISGPVILNKLRDDFRSYIASRQQHPRGPKGIVAQASSLIQRTEPDLPYEAMLEIIDIFRTDSNAAEIYITLKPEALRRAWVRHELKKIDFVLPSESGPSGSGSGESAPSF